MGEVKLMAKSDLNQKRNHTAVILYAHTHVKVGIRTFINIYLFPERGMRDVLIKGGRFCYDGQIFICEIQQDEGQIYALSIHLLLMSNIFSIHLSLMSNIMSFCLPQEVPNRSTF